MESNESLHIKNDGIESEICPKKEKKQHLPMWAVLISYIIGYLYVTSFLFGFAVLPTWSEFLGASLQQWGRFLFVVAFFLWADAALRCKDKMLSAENSTGRRGARPKEHWFWLGCTFLLVLVPILGRGNALHGWGSWLYALALHGCAVYWVLCRSGCLTENSTGPFFLWDVFDGFVIAPFGGIFLRLEAGVDALLNFIRKVRLMQRDKTNFKSLVLTIVVVLAALPVLGTVGGLLSEADAIGFAQFWNGLTALLQFKRPMLPDWTAEAVVRFCFSLPVGAYLFGLVGRCVLRERAVLSSGEARSSAERLRVVPTMALLAVFVLFCGLYMVFFVFQAGHLFGAFWGIVPGTATAAEYAREGFFQLCQVMFINFGLLAAAAKIGHTPIRQQKGLRLFALLLMAESILLAITAASKLGLYIIRFGFTPLRLLSVWAVFVLAAGSILALISILRPFRAVQKWVWLSVASFVLLCLY